MLNRDRQGADLVPEQGFRFMDSLRLIVRGTSLGDIHTLAAYPTMSSHRELTAKHQAEPRPSRSGTLHAGHAVTAPLQRHRASPALLRGRNRRAVRPRQAPLCRP
jgi:hypothetical protein